MPHVLLRSFRFICCASRRGGADGAGEVADRCWRASPPCPYTEAKRPLRLMLREKAHRARRRSKWRRGSLAGPGVTRTVNAASSARWRKRHPRAFRRSPETSPMPPARPRGAFPRWPHHDAPRTRSSSDTASRRHCGCGCRLTARDRRHRATANAPRSPAFTCGYTMKKGLIRRADATVDSVLHSCPAEADKGSRARARGLRSAEMPSGARVRRPRHASQRCSADGTRPTKRRRAAADREHPDVVVGVRAAGLRRRPTGRRRTRGAGAPRSQHDWRGAARPKRCGSPAEQKRKFASGRGAPTPPPATCKLDSFAYETSPRGSGLTPEGNSEANRTK
jgi:hypothetical protein